MWLKFFMARRIAVLPAAIAAIALAAAAAFAPVSGQHAADAITGRWSGELAVQGVRLPLVFHIVAEGGTATATMDSPMQGVRGVPIEGVRLAGDQLELTVPSLSAVYRGRLVESDRLEGEWSQGPISLPLELRRGRAEDVGPARPQHPVPPYPYREEEVRFANAPAGVELAGTLTLPEGAGPFPAVALVTGSGPQDRDETMLGHKPFLVLADHLTRAGIAVLRYDDRGVGESGGDFASASSLDFAGDAAAAVAFLKQHPSVDRDRVGLLGHSEGGLIAPLVATGAHGVPQRELAFVVLVAGPALSGADILRLQGAALARASGSSEEDLAISRRLQDRMFEVMKAEADDARRRDRMRRLLVDALDEMTPESREARGIPQGSEAAWVEGQLAAITTPWFREFVMLDPDPVLRRLRVPTLALFGGLDLQVPPRENMAAMQAALEAAGNPDFTVRELPRLNHLFQTATTGLPAEYATIEETFAPVALNAISEWITARFAHAVAK